MCQDAFVVTKEGRQRFQEEYESLKGKRAVVAQKVSDAREKGDLSENAAYKAAREEQSFIERRIAELEEILKRVKTIEHEGRCDRVGIGCRVRLRLKDREQEFKIVGALEADPTAGRISFQSPLGEELIGKRVGDTVEISAPAGKIICTVEEID